jgi:hypothetical protein
VVMEGFYQRCDCTAVGRVSVGNSFPKAFDFLSPIEVENFSSNLSFPGGGGGNAGPGRDANHSPPPSAELKTE